MSTDIERINKLENDMVDMKIRVKVVETDVMGMKNDLKEIKDDTKWLRRTFTSAIIITVLGFLSALLIWGIKGGIQ